jgi:hypothetical protein
MVGAAERARMGHACIRLGWALALGVTPAGCDPGEPVATATRQRRVRLFDAAETTFALPLELGVTGRAVVDTHRRSRPPTQHSSTTGRRRCASATAVGRRRSPGSSPRRRSACTPATSTVTATKLVAATFADRTSSVLLAEP